MKISSSQGQIALPDSGSGSFDLPKPPVVLDAIEREGGAVPSGPGKNFGFDQDEIANLSRPLSELGNLFGKSVRLDMTDGLGSVKIRIIDNESNKVLREYPPEDFLDLLKRVQRTLGLFVDEKV